MQHFSVELMSIQIRSKGLWCLRKYPQWSRNAELWCIEKPVGRCGNSPPDTLVVLRGLRRVLLMNTYRHSLFQCITFTSIQTQTRCVAMTQQQWSHVQNIVSFVVTLTIDGFVPLGASTSWHSEEQIRVTWRAHWNWANMKRYDIYNKNTDTIG